MDAKAAAYRPPTYHASPPTAVHTGTIHYPRAAPSSHSQNIVQSTVTIRRLISLIPYPISSSPIFCSRSRRTLGFLPQGYHRAQVPRSNVACLGVGRYTDTLNGLPAGVPGAAPLKQGTQTNWRKCRYSPAPYSLALRYSHGPDATHVGSNCQPL